jgi:NMD protein affecting ribosome stability and mRNA decay
MKCVKCGRRFPASELGAKSSAGAMCDDCWNKTSDYEAVRFVSMGVWP